jgi:molybdenum cofactor cytidylyltransferase
VIDEAARSRLDELVVVLGHRADEISAALELPSHARFVVNADYGRGMGSSLRAGLRAAGADAAAAAVLLGDQIVGAERIDAVIAAYGSAGAPIVRPVYPAPGGGRVPGHPVIVSRAIWSHIEAVERDEGLRGLIAAHPEWVDEVESEAPAPRDIDTWEDYLSATEDEGAARP